MSSRVLQFCPLCDDEFTMEHGCFNPKPLFTEMTDETNPNKGYKADTNPKEGYDDDKAKARVITMEKGGHGWGHHVKCGSAGNFPYMKPYDTIDLIPYEDYLALQSELEALKEKLLHTSVGLGHYKSERDIHIQESKQFVKEATEKINALTKERDGLLAALNCLAAHFGTEAVTNIIKAVK